MAKIILDTITGGYDLSLINDNFDKIEAEFQNKVLYRNNPIGEANTLQTDVDANGKRIYNLPEPLLNSEAARLQDVQNAVAGGAANLITFTPYGTVVSTNVQAAIQEILDEDITASELSASSGSSLVGFIQSGAGAASRTVQSKLRDFVSVKDFGAVGDGAADDTAAIQAAIDSGAGRIYIPAGRYKCTSTITVNGKNGFTIEGDAAAAVGAGVNYAHNSVLIFDTASLAPGLEIKNFVGMRLSNLVISQMRGGLGNTFGLYIHTGHDFMVENVKVNTDTGLTGSGIVLGAGSGATSAFNGTLRNVKVMSIGGTDSTIISNASNTSLVFDSCYAFGGKIQLNGTVYSTFNACAAEFAALYAYEINDCKGIVFNGCGGEANGRGVFYLSTSASNIQINCPVGVANNSAAVAGQGDLVHIDSSSGAVFNVTITNPTSLSPNAATTANIHATAGTGRVSVVDSAGVNLSRGVGGDATWLATKLELTGDLAVRNFTPVQGTGWTFTGSPVFSGTFVRSGNAVEFEIDITGYTDVTVGSQATITLPFAPTGFGTAAIHDDNAAFISGGLIVGTTLFVPAFTIRTVPLRIIGHFKVA